MSLFLVAIIPGLIAVAGPVALIGVILWLVSQRAPDDGGGAPARTARRHELLVSTLAGVAAVAVAFVLLAQPVRWPAWAPAPGVIQALTPLAIAVVFALVRGLGELTWPRPRGAVRTAPLTRRSPRSLAGARLTGVVLTGALLAVGLVVTGVTADSTGRAFTSRPVTLPDAGVVSGANGPYPGWPYGAPMLVGLALVAVATWLALTAITRRRPLAGVPAAHDDAVRRTSCDRLLAGVQLCLGLAVAGTAWFAGHAIAARGRGFEVDGRLVEDDLLTAIGVTIIVAGVVVALVSAVVALLAVGSRRVQAADRPTGGRVLA
ncbi:hypothetical protein [Xylanimonas ulmi]|uniref:Uncharacterized protein n=1 Tax=Xylanimonas ulmi TaxID=228973 RepID=A0A4Q7LZG3_9MICO|nr:hypothetical protein [Xylanibacterium ulmi]RZS60191.1 hypothetical protein EV386_0440 [Xylanibacterium ulmi]